MSDSHSRHHDDSHAYDEKDDFDLGNQKKKLIQKEKESIFIFRPNDSFKSKWDLLVMASAVFNCITIPLKVAFMPAVLDSPFFVMLNLIIDCVFGADIVVSFRTAYISSIGEEVVNPKKIAMNYIAS